MSPRFPSVHQTFAGIPIVSSRKHGIPPSSPPGALSSVGRASRLHRDVPTSTQHTCFDLTWLIRDGAGTNGHGKTTKSWCCPSAARSRRCMRAIYRRLLHWFWRPNWRNVFCIRFFHSDDPAPCGSLHRGFGLSVSCLGRPASLWHSICGRPDCCGN